MSTEQHLSPQSAEELLREAVLASGSDGLESWQVTLDLLEGWVTAAVGRGWPEPMARAMVFEQVRWNLRIGVVNAEATRP